jgi:hypothetical protein
VILALRQSVPLEAMAIAVGAPPQGLPTHGMLASSAYRGAVDATMHKHA